MLASSRYFENTWISGSFPVKLWCHFDNVGPRTTNLAEGWHNSLNHTFGMPHPSPRNFLSWLQKCQFAVQCREIQLEAGRPAKRQSSIYMDLDNRIASEKRKFGVNAGYIFYNMYTLCPQQDVWPVLSGTIATYLREMSYLIGEKAT